MSFEHVAVNGNPPLVASYCAACTRLIAMSIKEELLATTEKGHKCPRPPARNRKTSSTKEVSSRVNARIGLNQAASFFCSFGFSMQDLSHWLGLFDVYS
jgi:hypothetical protein